MKLTIIGAGSSYTPEIIDGLLGQPCFGALEVALYDLPEGTARARIICDMALRMAKKRGAQATIEVVPQLDEALRGSEDVYKRQPPRRPRPSGRPPTGCRCPASPAQRPRP